jgi:hypothetical protein
MLIRDEEEATLRLHAAALAQSPLGRRWARLWSLGAVLALLMSGALAERAFAAPTTVALWHMDETSGSVMRDAARNHNGALRSVQLRQPGFSGFAYGFTGSSYVTVPSAADLNAGSANLTVTIHLKTTLTPKSDWDVIRKGVYETRGGEFKVEYQHTGQASCGFKGSARYSELIAGPRLNDGRWHKVQCVKTSSAISLIVDGRAYSKAVTIGSISNNVAVAIGSRPGAQYFKGTLDEASIQIG